MNPNSLLKDLEDFQKVQKYEISEEDYEKLPSKIQNFVLSLGNFRKFRAMLEQNPNFFTEKKKM